jgi:hypothetical protein
VLHCAELLDRADYPVTLARLAVLDWLHPSQETPVDRAIREKGERLRKAFPWLDERRKRPWVKRRMGAARGAPDPDKTLIIARLGNFHLAFAAPNTKLAELETTGRPS